MLRRSRTGSGSQQPLRAEFIGYDEMPGNYQDVRHRIPDTTKARELLGFEAKVSLEDGLTRTIEWHREQRLRVRAASGAGLSGRQAGGRR